MLFFNKNRSSDAEMRLRIYRREQCKYTKNVPLSRTNRSRNGSRSTLANPYL